MIGTMLRILLPMLAPFVAFFAWRLLVTRGRGLLDNTPWFLLTIASLLMAIGGFATLALLPGAVGQGEWVPPRLEDGRIVPGHVAPAE
jgi:hypothetical protein